MSQVIVVVFLPLPQILIMQPSLTPKCVIDRPIEEMSACEGDIWLT